MKKLPETQKSSDLRTPTSIDEYGKGVVLYMKNESIVGVLLWNVFKRIPIARQVFYPTSNA